MVNKTVLLCTRLKNENKEINSAEYQNVIKEISSQYSKHPEKRNKFAVFKE